MRKLYLLVLPLIWSGTCLGAPVGGATVAKIAVNPATPIFDQAFAINVDGIIHTCYDLESSYSLLGSEIRVDVQIEDTSSPTTDCLDPATWRVEMTVTEELPKGEYEISVYLNDEESPVSKAFSVVDDYGQVILSPPSGVYLSSQHFDFAVILKGVSAPITSSSAVLNDIDVTQAVKNCITAGMLKDSGRTYSCSALVGGMFSTGENVLVINMTLADSIAVSESVTWEILEVGE